MQHWQIYILFALNKKKHESDPDQLMVLGLLLMCEIILLLFS